MVRCYIDPRYNILALVLARQGDYNFIIHLKLRLSNSISYERLSHTNPMMITIHLKTIRQAKNITIRQLALMSRVSKSQISEIENGKTMPTIKTLCMLAEALKVSPEQLYSYDGKVSDISDKQ